MANISVTYTFANSTTADATQVNQNFQDIIDGTSNGTKDFSISALTCAGNVAFNGNTTIGNASADTLTITASLASSIPLSAHNSYDIGSLTTLGLRAIYFASSSATKTAKLQGPASSSDVTLTLPAFTGTLGLAPTAVSKSADYSAATTDELIYCDATSAGFTITLPAVSTVPAGKIYRIQKVDSSFNLVTVDGNGTETIDGALTKKCATQYESIVVQTTGSAWVVIARRIPGDSQSYSATLSNSTNVNLSSNFWQRVGDKILIQGRLTWNGAGAGGTFTLALPSGLTFDTTNKINASVESSHMGHGSWFDNGTARKSISVLYNSTTTVLFELYSDGALAGTGFASGDNLSYTFMAPISNWEG